MEQQRHGARALARFFSFLHTARGGKSWRAATEGDHLAFHQWRRRDDAGPHVEGSTWNHEVSLVNQFYEWAVRQRYHGLEPAMLWLNENGLTMSISGWQAVFCTANDRCHKANVLVEAHAHLLRHTFAVVTLEQLQRAHVAQLAELNSEQRGHYTRIFGDPLDWVRCRLGHRSILTTLIYLHALQELEMETRMALVPDTWDDPRDTPLTQIGDDAVPADAEQEAVR
ncbi:site-specific integrase [Streptomyces sp. NPDC054855]